MNLLLKMGVLKNFDRRDKLMDIDLEEETYAEIVKMIHSDSSPVGIDAKKTHVYIIHMLQQIDKRLAALENRAGKDECK